MYIIKSSTDSSPSTSLPTEIFAYLYVPLIFILAIVGGLVMYCRYPIKEGRRRTYVVISADAGAPAGDLGVTTGGGGGLEPFGYGTVAATGTAKKTGAEVVGSRVVASGEVVDGVYVHAASPSSGSNSSRSEEKLV
ncbi:uncharacterized protein L3040_005136 [Drepanopeziza brunnea f. sp. 'multigermtubi']|uniref:uncharacterized protein n=1 Tax=Drepanopeziza brunnea f. sp. 'multigermtubi' TaxID=698441 RepID=UPI00239C6084|nr:hypothetical protein L3040_005136 [Drepanopeziza brunnea f. sp. 'multigermtubi']